MGMLARWIWRDHCLDAALCQPIAQACCVVSSVGEQSAGQAGLSQELSGASQIVSVAGRNEKRKRTPQIVGQRVDFGRPPAPRAADRVMEGPPFAPAAERCALMCVLSIDIVPIIPVEPVSA
jgi:hypothetical protein